MTDTQRPATGNGTASVVIYRSSGAAWKVRAALIDVDGTPAGRLRSGDRLELNLTGTHTIRAHIGDTWTPPVTVDADASTHEPTILALRATLPDRSSGDAAAGPLNLVLTSDFNDRGLTLRDVRRNRSPIPHRVVSLPLNSKTYDA